MAAHAAYDAFIGLQTHFGEVQGSVSAETTTM